MCWQFNDSFCRFSGTCRFNVSVSGVVAAIRSPDVSRREKVGQGMRLEKGKTPVRVGKMFPFLSRYPDQESARLLGEGFTGGFRIPCTLTGVPPVSPNLQLALQFPEVVLEKLSKEVSLGRMSGDFFLSSYCLIHLS